jgi:hypothetical protein
MPLSAIPVVDAQICSGWTEQQENLYNNLSFYLAKLQVEKRKTWATHSKLIGKIPWKPNQGPLMRGVRKEPSPHLRQFAFPTVLGSIPRKDVTDLRELRAEVQVSRHRFESPVLTFLPSFRDFMTDHVSAQGEDLEEKKMRFEDIFVRGHIFHNSPYIWLPNGGANELLAAPIGDGNRQGTSGKTTAFLQATQALVGSPGNLTLTTINKLVTVAETDLRVPPYSGSGGQPRESGPLSDKFCLVLDSEAWNQFMFDPFILANKSCDLNIITEGFRGDLFGRVTCKLEDMPLRMLADGTFPQPEIREVNPDAYNFGESIPNPTNTSAPFGVAFLYGRQDSYKSLTVGPPPKDFAGNGMPDGFGKMFWNGELILSKNLVIPCIDEDTEEVVYEANVYGEYLKFFSQITLGCLPQQRRNVIPILYKRTRGPAVEA